MHSPPPDGLGLVFYATMQLSIVQSTDANGTDIYANVIMPFQLLFDFFSCWQVDSTIEEDES